MLTINLEQIVKDINNRRKHVRYPFQETGLMLAKKLGDPKHKALYMKLAKNEERELLMDTLHHVTATHEEQGNVGALFMWKLKELKNRPIEPVGLRFALNKEQYYIVGEIKNALRGELPLMLGSLRRYEEKYPEEVTLSGKKLKFPHLDEIIIPLLERFKAKGRIVLLPQWVWKGKETKFTSGKGEFMLNRPRLIKREFKR